MHDAVGPESLAVAGPPRAGGQPLEDLADGHPLVDQPAVQHPDHFGLRRVDLQMPGDAVPLGDVAVAVGGAAGAPLAGAGLLQLAAAEALGEDSPLVLGDGPLDLEQELVVRVVRDRPLDELNVAGGLAKFLQQEDLVGVASGQSIRAVDADDVEFALARGVAEAVEGRAIEPSAGVTLIDVNMIVFEFVAVGGGPATQGVELAVNRLVASLLVGRDPGVNRGSHDPRSDLDMNYLIDEDEATRAGSRRPARVAWTRHDGEQRWSR
jgi:hypothetical protein